MAWCNNFTASPLPDLKPEELYGPEPYDYNFCYKLNFDVLQNDRVALEPFIPRKHAKSLYDAITAHPELYHYLPVDLPKSLEELVAQQEIFFRSRPGEVNFAIIDKTGPDGEPHFAGTLSYINTIPHNMSTEIGFVVILPEFHHTHVTTNAVGLLIQNWLNHPTDKCPGLGQRRVQWSTNIDNTASLRTAERLGFRREGTMRWNWVLPEGKEGIPPSSKDSVRGPGRHSALFSMCWDDWENGGREKVLAEMERKK